MAATWVSLSNSRYLGERAIQSVQAATEAAPAQASEGFPLDGAGGFTLTLECDAGQSFAGVEGQLDLYQFDQISGTPWSVVLDRELTIPPSAVGLRRFTILFTVASARGRIAYIANGLNLTGGGITLTFAPAAGPQPGRHG
jgi:hypothetical protein